MVLCLGHECLEKRVMQPCFYPLSVEHAPGTIVVSETLTEALLYLLVVA